MIERLKRYIYLVLGREMPIISADRYRLEQKIIPYFVPREELAKVLFVG